MKKKSIAISSLALALSPVFVFAQTYYYSQCSTNTLTLCTIIDRIVGYLNQVLVLLIGLSVVTFVYYVFKYFVRPNENRAEAGKYVMYSLIGFFVMLSLWGLVNILQNTFGLGNATNAPQSWTDFTHIFPSAGGASSLDSTQSSGIQQSPEVQYYYNPSVSSPNNGGTSDPKCFANPTLPGCPGMGGN